MRLLHAEQGRATQKSCHIEKSVFSDKEREIHAVLMQPGGKVTQLLESETSKSAIIRSVS